MFGKVPLTKSNRVVNKPVKSEISSKKKPQKVLSSKIYQENKIQEI